VTKVLHRGPEPEDKTDSVRRSFEIEDPTNLYVIHPISARLVPLFARLGITPNAVSLIGMGCGLLAGLSYHFYHHTGCALAGFALMLAWHVMDGADGQLARLTKTYSNLGKVLDGICDYVTFTSVYVGLALTLSASLGTWVWLVVALSGLCHAVQSAAYEMQRQEYDFWGRGKLSAALPARTAGLEGLGWRDRTVTLLHQTYTSVQLWASRGTLAFHSRFSALLSAQPDRQVAFRDAYRRQFAPLVRRWGVLSSNYRTLSIFLAALLKLPLLYFSFEIIGFSIIMLILLKAQTAQNAAFLRRLERR
jgi:CDP-diacylglycerol--serine O-phosphatidyltransferase